LREKGEEPLPETEGMYLQIKEIVNQIPSEPDETEEALPETEGVIYKIERNVARGYEKRLCSQTESFFNQIRQKDETNLALEAASLVGKFEGWFEGLKEKGEAPLPETEKMYRLLKRIEKARETLEFTF
jgi:hypothetical protein